MTAVLAAHPDSAHPDAGRGVAQRALSRLHDARADLAERRAVLTRIASLDPDRDDHELTNLVLGRVFCDAWFHHALFTVAYWRQVAVRTIAPVIAQRGYGDTLTGTVKRTDDTLLFFGLLYRDGYRTSEAVRTIDRLSAIHKNFDIKTDDYRYTLATLCFEPTRMANILGVRGLTPAEERAVFGFWRGVGREWGVAIPETQAEFEQWFYQYERDNYERTAEGVQITRAMTAYFLDRWAPGPLRPLGAQFLRALADDLLLDTVDYEPASPAVRRAAKVAVTAYFRARRALPGPNRTDNIIRPWASEYGANPNPGEVGPAWARKVQPEAREPQPDATGCPF